MQFEYVYDFLEYVIWCQWIKYAHGSLNEFIGVDLCHLASKI